MADIKDNITPTSNSALGLLDTLSSTALNRTDWTSPAAYMGSDSAKRIPQGKIKTEEEVGKSFSTSSKVDAPEKAKEDKGMDLMTWYMLTRPEGDNLGQESDAEFGAGFQAFVKIMGLEKTEITYQGQKITMGELAEKMTSSITGLGEGYPQGILSQSRLPVGSPLSAKAIADAEKLAQSKGVLGSIQQASRIVGVDETYMLLKAKQESGFNPHAHAKTSSAGGLYQFLDSTWVATANKHKDLLEKYLHVDVDSMSRGQVLQLKENAFASSLMGAAFAKDNKQYLERNVNVPGFKADAGAMYMAHFLGPAGAEKFFENLARNPNASAAAIFGREAAANASVFAGKTLRELERWADNKVSGPAPVLS